MDLLKSKKFDQLYSIVLVHDLKFYGELLAFVKFYYPQFLPYLDNKRISKQLKRRLFRRRLKLASFQRSERKFCSWKSLLARRLPAIRNFLFDGVKKMDNENQ